MRNGLSAAVLMTAVIGWGVVTAAQESQRQPLTLRERVPLTGPEFSTLPTPAPQEIRDLMRMNNRVIAVDNLSEAAGGAAGGAAAPAGVTTFGGSLSKYLTPDKEDYDGVLKDAATLRANFSKIEMFFADRKSAEGVELAQAGEKSIGDLEAAAKVKNRVEAIKAEIGVSVACRNCHIGHRVLLITMPMSYGVIG